MKVTQDDLIELARRSKGNDPDKRAQQIEAIIAIYGLDIKLYRKIAEPDCPVRQVKTKYSGDGDGGFIGRLNTR